MKKYIVPFLVGILLLVGCSSNEPSENAQKAIDKVVNYLEVANASEDIDYSDIENNFSFKIYEDSNTKALLIESYSPSKEEPNKYLDHYYYDIDTDNLTYYAADSDYNKKLDSGDYSIIYTSGKFAE
ncbi:hypothetical protein [Enterococcus sp. LJL90]